MAAVDLARTVAVLDLDDTLYPEADYVRSGIAHVCDRLDSMLGRSFHAELSAALVAGEKDWLSFLCRQAGFPPSVKESLLWMYRLHPPSIALAPSCAAILQRLDREAKAVLILTDGRSVTQRLKIKALGLSHLPAYISEDHRSEKPDALRFQMIERDCPADHYVYVGDNPAKDFLAGNAMGWTTVGLRGKGGNIHPADLDGLPAGAAPQFWIDDWEGLFAILC
jgi:putative hydrolase of the HAD superfamily